MSSLAPSHNYRARVRRRLYTYIEARARVVGDEAQVVARYIEEDVA